MSAPPPSTVRRVVVAAAAVGLALAGLVLPGGPAEGQPNPSISVSPTSAPGGSSGTWSIVVSGQNWRAGRVLSIRFASDQPTSYTPPSTSFSTTITPVRRFAGTYTISVIQDLCDFDSCPVERTASFTSVPVVTLEPACSNTGTSQALVVRGAAWNPQFPVSVTYDYPSSNVQSFAPSGDGSFARSFTVTPPPRDVVVFVEQPRLQLSSRAIWSPCPPPGSTSTTTSTSTIPSTTSTTEPDDTTPTTSPAPTTTTTAPSGPGPTIPLPPTVPLPPPTPGATLTLTPKLGPTGFVTGVRGTGFPPNALVALRWQPGVGSASAITGLDGTFATRVLVLPNDRLGPRALVATSGATTAYDAFLVLPSTVQPSGGQNVAQISRVRRFLKR